MNEDDKQRQAPKGVVEKQDKIEIIAGVYWDTKIAAVEQGDGASVQGHVTDEMK